MFCQLVFRSTLGLVLFKKLFLKKERYGESYIARVFQWLSYLGIFTETSATLPDEAVAAVNLRAQGSGSVSEAVFHPDLTTVRQQIVGDVVTSGREDGKNYVKETKNFRTIVLNDGSRGSISLLF